MKMNLKSFLKLTVVASVLTTFWLTVASAWATGSSSLVIAEIYGGGGNSGATYSNDFVVVFNRGTSPVDVNNWSIQYASATGTSWAVNKLATTSTQIPAGGYFLVKLASNAAVGGGLPTADSSPASPSNMSGTAGKVALCNSSTALTGAAPTGGSIVDFVGFGTTANANEGGANAPVQSSTTSDQRASGGCTDLDNNGTDFATAAPNPRNSLTATHSCAVVVPPTIASISPSSIATNAGNIVQFTVTNSAGDAPLTYFWFKETGSSTNLISVTTTNTIFGTLTLPNVILADVANYQVIVSNASTFTATSAVVSLTAVVDPAINFQPPPSQTLLQNSTARFTVGAGGTPTVGCQWYTGTPGAGSPVNNGGRISGANTSSLSISSLAGSDANTYFVIVTNAYGSVTSSVTALTVVASSGALAYWDFNGNYVDPNGPAPTYGAGTAASVNVLPFVLPPSAADGNDIDNATGEGLDNNGWGTQNYPLATVSNKLAGVRFNVSTVGAKNVTVSYDVRATTTASKYERLQFTTNGADFIDFPASSKIITAGSFQPQTFSLAGFPGVRNNPNFGIRIVTEFENTANYGNTNDATYIGASSSSTYNPSGTISYDMVTISGDAITSANTPPTINPIGDQTLLDQTSTNVSLTVGDAETPGSIRVSALSLNQTVLNNPSVNGTTLTITPKGVDGVAPVLVTVTDGNGEYAATWFNVTTVPQNQPPTISGLIPTNTLVNVPITLPFTVGDDATPGSITLAEASLNTTLVPDGNISFGGSGANRTVTIAGAHNQLGVAPITITVNDNDPTTPKSTALTIPVTVRPNTNVVLNDYFDYVNSGTIISQSGGFWQNHSGTVGQMQVAPGQVTIDGVNNSEDVNALLIGQPFPTNNNVVLYSSFKVNFSTLPTQSGSYFAHFKDNTTFGFFGRVWASTLNAAAGSYRLGIGNSSGVTNTSGQFPRDLALGTNYTVVTRLVLSNGFSTIWINPSSEQDTHTGDFTTVTNLAQIYSYALREATGEGVMAVNDLKIGLSFADVVDILTIQSAGTNAILCWENPVFSLQCSTNVTGPYTTVTGAGSPCTNNANSPTKFYRLMR